MLEALFLYYVMLRLLGNQFNLSQEPQVVPSPPYATLSLSVPFIWLSAGNYLFPVLHIL
jgi:hypothetical protein